MSLTTGMRGQPAQSVHLPSDGSCLTAACHQDIGEFSQPHAVQEECSLCHEQVGDGHEFVAIPDTPSLCGQCHDVTSQANVHVPAEADCLGCHLPHGSNNSRLLIEAEVDQLCFSCHDPEIVGKAFQHGPAGAGVCGVCHDPHSSDEQKLLRTSINSLCSECHVDVAEAVALSKSVHSPVSTNCVLCHDPHSGSEAQMLPATGRQLCASCHDSITASADQATVSHAPVQAPDGCTSCHDPHASYAAALLARPEMELCLDCHDRRLPEQQPVLANMEELFVENQDWHGPISEGSCAGCHQVHGGKNFRLLADHYPASFYSAFDRTDYALCFTCHDESAVTERSTSTLTGFRDADLNLHFLHVVRDRRGRTCRACHEVHASKLPFHVRESVPYGTWELPINFQATDEGGSCQPGCHKPLSYNRNNQDSAFR